MAEKILKEHIVSFRIPKDQAAVVAKMVEELKPVNVRSVNQFFRKIGMDFFAGRLGYKNSADLYIDTTTTNV